MNTWDKNLAFFYKHFPDFYQKATTKEYSCPGLKIKEAGTGNLFLGLEETQCFLHSRYDVEREIKELLGEESSSEQILIIFGLGMGYVLDYIQKYDIEYKQILIIEPHNDVFKELLKYRDFEALLKKRGVSLSIFKDAREILPKIMGQVMTSRNVKFVYHIAYRSIFSELFQEISRLFTNEKRAFLGSTATVDYFIHEWTENQLLSIARNHPNAIVFNNRFENIPAIIVAAGPSLERRFDELRAIGDGALIIAAGTGAKICTNNNIKAHMGIAMDSQKAEADIFKNSISDVLVGSYRLHPDVSKVFPNSFYQMVLSNEFVAQYYCEYYNIPFEIINDHASISSSAVDFAVKLGCNPIVLVGQDMCYYEDKVHAGDKGRTISDSVRDKMVEAVDINGEKVYTHPGFLAIRRDMENLNVKYGDKQKFINATEAGLGIPGVENWKLSGVIEDYINSHSHNVSEIIQEITGSAPSVDNNININEFYEHILKEITWLEEMNEKKLAAMRELAETIEKSGSKNLRTGKMKEIEKINGDMEQSAFYMRLVGRMLNHFLLFYKAGAMYEFNDKPDNSEAFLYYETNLLRLTHRYMEKIKSFVTRLLIAKDYNKQYEGANFTVSIGADETNAGHSLSIPFDVQGERGQSN